MAITPVNTAQDVLRKVLGLFLAQHQGGGKAEQIFLRGFDNDHGTDIAIYSDGMPANVVSHAHGQGYADLHFIIPEVIQSIAYNKGSYYIKRGDFNTSGYVDLNTFKRLPQSMIKVEGGNYSTARVVGMVNLLPHKITNQNAYAAVEYNYTNGPFEIPQNFSRLNAFFKYNIQLKKTFINLQASSFTSSWNGSGQIPLRAIRDYNNGKGLVNRFESLDSSEGGTTSRNHVILHINHKLNDDEQIKSLFYFSQYSFDLWSDFTFFLVNPEKGDAIHQSARRNIYGMVHQYEKKYHFHNGSKLTFTAGMNFRYDDIKDLGLQYVTNRQISNGYMAKWNGTEANIGLNVGLRYDIKKWSIQPGLRLDYQLANDTSLVFKPAEESEDAPPISKIQPLHGRGMLGK